MLEECDGPIEMGRQEDRSGEIEDDDDATNPVVGYSEVRPSGDIQACCQEPLT